MRRQRWKTHKRTINKVIIIKCKKKKEEKKNSTKNQQQFHISFAWREIQQLPCQVHVWLSVCLCAIKRRRWPVLPCANAAAAALLRATTTCIIRIHCNWAHNEINYASTSILQRKHSQWRRSEVEGGGVLKCYVM